MGRRGILFAIAAAAVLVALAFWRAERPGRAPARSTGETDVVPAGLHAVPVDAPGPPVRLVR